MLLQAVYSASVSYFLIDFCQTNYLKFSGTDLCQILQFSTTVAVDDQSEIMVFQSLDGRFHDSQILLVSVHVCSWTQAARGAAGWANVGFSPVSSCRKVDSSVLSAYSNLLLLCIV